MLTERQMTKRAYIEWRQGAAAFKRGVAFALSASHSWKMGWLDAEYKSRAVAA